MCVTLWQWTCGADFCTAVVGKENVYPNISIVFPQTQNTESKKWDCNCFPIGQPHSFPLMFQYALNARVSNHWTEWNEPTWPPVSACLTSLQCFTCGYICNTINTQKTNDSHHLTDKLYCSNDNLLDMLHLTYVKIEYCLDVWNATSSAHTEVF